jgi:hypothetical protein
MTDQDWVKPGAPCVVLQPYDRTAAMRAEDAVIDRVLTRDVVVKLTSGNRAGEEDRFRRIGLERRDGGTWGTTTYLVPPDDARIPKVREEIQRRRLRDRASAAYESWRRGNTGPAEVSGAFEALAAFEQAGER